MKKEEQGKRRRGREKGREMEEGIEAMNDDERRMNPKKQKFDTSGRRRCSQQVPEPRGSFIGAGKVRLPSRLRGVKEISKIVYWLQRKKIHYCIPFHGLPIL